MAIKKVYIGSVGPFLFDDAAGVNDVDGDFAGQTQQAVLTDGAISADAAIGLFDSDQSNILNLVWNEDDTADRTFQFLVGGGNRSLTLNENFTIGDGSAGTLTYSSVCTLTIELASVLNQDLTTDASPTFASLSLGTGELTAGSINRVSGALTLEIGGTAILTVAIASVAIAQTVILSNCINAGADVDKFLVLDASNNIDYRTGAEVLSDIGGGKIFATAAVLGTL